MEGKENGEVSSIDESIGYIIREEKLFQGNNYKNGIYQLKTEGQRVAKGDPIFRYYTSNENDLIEKIAKLDSQIQDALQQNQNSIYSSDIAAIDSQIEERLKKGNVTVSAKVKIGKKSFSKKCKIKVVAKKQTVKKATPTPKKNLRKSMRLGLLFKILTPRIFNMMKITRSTF